MSNISIDHRFTETQQSSWIRDEIDKYNKTLLPVKGMTNMDKKKLQCFASECVTNYATYNKLNNFYFLDVSSLPDFVQDEFAALIIEEDESLSWEATGPDNKYWETKMLPALLRYLKNSTDKDESIEFTNTWRTCVTSYFLDHMQELINFELGNFNYEKGYYKTSEESYGLPKTL